MDTQLSTPQATDPGDVDIRVRYTAAITAWHTELRARFDWLQAHCPEMFKFFDSGDLDYFSADTSGYPVSQAYDHAHAPVTDYLRGDDGHPAATAGLPALLDEMRRMTLLVAHVSAMYDVDEWKRYRDGKVNLLRAATDYLHVPGAA